MIRVVFSFEGESDALGAFEFYEERREGLGERFRDHVSVALGRIQQNPDQWRVCFRWLGTDAHDVEIVDYR